MNPARLELILGEATTSSAAFAPTDITGLALWLDATDASTITLDGSNNVSQWRDKSGNANHGAQATTTARPSGTGSINGKTALTFDGVDDLLQIANSASINLGPTMSVFAVHRTATTAARQTVIGFVSDGSTASPMLELGTQAGQYTRAYCVIRPGAFMIQSATDTLTTSPSLIGFMVDSSANLVLRKNGVEVATAASAGATLVGSGGQKLIGARTITTQPFSGTMGEIVVFNKRLSAGETTQIESYLILKWGIT